MHCQHVLIKIKIKNVSRVCGFRHLMPSLERIIAILLKDNLTVFVNIVNSSTVWPSITKFRNLSYRHAPVQRCLQKRFNCILPVLVKLQETTYMYRSRVSLCQCCSNRSNVSMPFKGKRISQKPLPLNVVILFCDFSNIYNY